MDIAKCKNLDIKFSVHCILSLFSFVSRSLRPNPTILQQLHVIKCPPFLRCWDLNPQPLEHESTPALRLSFSHESIIQSFVGIPATSKLEQNCSAVSLVRSFPLLIEPHKSNYLFFPFAKMKILLPCCRCYKTFFSEEIWIFLKLRN